MTYAGSRPRPGLRPVLVAVLVAILFLAALGAGFVALKQSKSTSQWRQSDLSEVARNSALVVRDRELSKVLVSAGQRRRYGLGRNRHLRRRHELAAGRDRRRPSEP